MKFLYSLPILLLTACSLAPDSIIPTDRVPQRWKNATSEATEPTAQWSDFNSAELNQLIATALTNNTDIAAALARVEQARANTTIAGAGLYPSVDASGSANNTRSNGTATDRSEASLAVAYELDLWQRNRNLSDSAAQQWKATRYDRDAVTLLVASEVARLYSGTLALDARVAVANDNLTNARDVLRITELRFKEGAVSGLEQAQQRTAVANTEASIAALKNQRELFFNQLALVVGTTPSQLQMAAESKLAQLQVPQVAMLSPWELLQRRPDIAASEARLRAANIDIGVARANALPSLSLALNAGVTGNPSGSLIGLAASFFAPIFRGGALQADIDRSEALRDERIANYQGVLLVAFREVEDALSNLEAAKARRSSLLLGAEEARKADAIARTRFDAGAIDFTTLLTTQSALLQAEDSYYTAVQNEFAAAIDLMRTLGGPSETTTN